MNYAHIALPQHAIEATELAMAEHLNGARILANAIERHAPQDETYGAVSTALRQALANIYRGDALAFGAEDWTRANAWASAVVEETIDNGESIPYSIRVVEQARTFFPGDVVERHDGAWRGFVYDHDALDAVRVRVIGHHELVTVTPSTVYVVDHV